MCVKRVCEFISLSLSVVRAADAVQPSCCEEALAGKDLLSASREPHISLTPHGEVLSFSLTNTRTAADSQSLDSLSHTLIHTHY